MANVADRLQEALGDRGWSQGKLARAIGVTQGAISQILLGKTTRSKHLPDIARQLGVSYDWLIGRSAKKSDAAGKEDAPIAAHEMRLIERLRALSPKHRSALTDITDAYLDVRLPDAPVQMPPEGHLAQMFEALLAGIDPDSSRAEQALLLAQRLPIGLSHLRHAAPGDHPPIRRKGESAGRADPATPDRVRTS